MMADTMLVAFLMGITGSLHCAGMCGAIMWAMPFYSFRGAKKVVAFSLYHIMRITAYVLMACILFSFRSLFHPGMQQAISVILGVLLLIAGLSSFLPTAVSSRVSLPWSAFVKKQLSAFVGQPQMGKIALAGFLNGMLPCGLVYVALTTCLTLSSPWQVVGTIYAFGLGTVPMLASIVFLRSRLMARSSAISKMAPMAVLFFGVLFVFRGLGLGIPYLSPKAKTVNGKLVHSCCSKKHIAQ